MPDYIGDAVAAYGFREWIESHALPGRFDDLPIELRMALLAALRAWRKDQKGENP